MNAYMTQRRLLNDEVPKNDEYLVLQDSLNKDRYIICHIRGIQFPFNKVFFFFFFVCVAVILTNDKKEKKIETVLFFQTCLFFSSTLETFETVFKK